MFIYSKTMVFFEAAPVSVSSVGFGDFLVRAGLGMTALVIFVSLCCLAWRTVPALKALIPGFFENTKEEAIDRSAILYLKPVDTAKTAPGEVATKTVTPLSLVAVQPDKLKTESLAKGELSDPVYKAVNG